MCEHEAVCLINILAVFSSPDAQKSGKVPPRIVGRHVVDASCLTVWMAAWVLGWIPAFKCAWQWHTAVPKTGSINSSFSAAATAKDWMTNGSVLVCPHRTIPSDLGST